MSNAYARPDGSGWAEDVDDNFRFSLASYQEDGKINSYSGGADPALNKLTRAQNQIAAETNRRRQPIGEPGNMSHSIYDALSTAVRPIRTAYESEHLVATRNYYRSEKNVSALTDELMRRHGSLRFADIHGTPFRLSRFKVRKLVLFTGAKFIEERMLKEIAYSNGPPINDDIAPHVRQLNNETLSETERILKASPEYYAEKDEDTPPAALFSTRNGGTRAHALPGGIRRTSLGVAPAEPNPSGIPVMESAAMDVTDVHGSLFWKPTEPNATKRRSSGKMLDAAVAVQKDRRFVKTVSSSLSVLVGLDGVEHLDGVSGTERVSLTDQGKLYHGGIRRYGTAHKKPLAAWDEMDDETRASFPRHQGGKRGGTWFETAKDRGVLF